jgi:hypothetical protein
LVAGVLGNRKQAVVAVLVDTKNLHFLYLLIQPLLLRLVLEVEGVAAVLRLPLEMIQF